MSMWSLRWHFTNKSVTGAPYSIKSYSLYTAGHYGKQYDDWNSAVLRSRRNCSSDGAEWTDDETAFHARAGHNKQYGQKFVTTTICEDGIWWYHMIWTRLDPRPLRLLECKNFNGFYRKLQFITPRHQELLTKLPRSTSVIFWRLTLCGLAGGRRQNWPRDVSCL